MRTGTKLQRAMSAGSTIAWRLSRLPLACKRRYAVAQTSETEVAEAMAVNLPDDLFAEKYVEADRFRIRYCEAGQGDPLLCLHGAGGLRLSPAHVLLAQHYRVIAFEVPGFGH